MGTERIKIVHVGTTHHAGDTRVFHKECRTLAEAGYEVVYIIPHAQDEIREGVQIRAVPVPANGKVRLTKTLWQIFRKVRAEGRTAICHFHDAEWILYGFILKLLGHMVVYDVHEDTPRQVMYFHWIPAWSRWGVSKLWTFFEWLGGWWFDGIIAAEPVTYQRFEKRNPALIHNFPIRTELIGNADLTSYPKRSPNVVYVGRLTAVRGVQEMLEALQGLHANFPETNLILGGSFHPASLAETVQAHPMAAQVDFRGWLDRTAVADVLAEAQVGLVLLHPTEKYIHSYPTKLFEYMAAGLPVVASNFPVWETIIAESQCGFTVDPFDTPAVVEAIGWLLAHPEEAAEMGQHGQRAIAERFNWAPEAQKLLRFYADLTS